MNLTAVEMDDMGSAFSIYDGQKFTFTQTGSRLLDTFRALRRYGISPLRYKQLSQEMARRFGSIYELQKQGRVFLNPSDMLAAMQLYNLTQQQAADYMQAELHHIPWRFGAARFAEELAGAVNRVNYNQPNQAMNALAGLVSYLPAADPDVYMIKEGNAALPHKLAARLGLQAVHTGAAVTAVQLDSNGQYMLTIQQQANSIAAGVFAQQQQQRREEQQCDKTSAMTTLKPFDGVVIATPLEGSGVQLLGLTPEPKIPKRTYQTTVTTYVAGHLNASYFKVASVPDGDVLVTSTADTPFSVIASKGNIPIEQTHVAAAAAAASDRQLQAGGQQNDRKHTDGANQHQQQRQLQLPLWKIFSEAPLSGDLLEQLFINSTVVVSKGWKAYPRFDPPEKFAPFLLGPALCYNNALENAASAMEVAAVAARNCALLLQKQLADSTRQMTAS
eukprot:GHRR01023577.1.p1 GENE.GHRR01023577.1~~GHRR01023577.1.p1  ORF type:complete len:446 (+),score=200.88 GHRR01023577.1:606-1943(+)